MMFHVPPSTSALFIFCYALLFLLCMAGQFQKQVVFRREANGGSLKSGEISRHNVESMMDCGQHCLQSKTCIGVNYKPTRENGEQNCQLTSKDSNPEEYEQEASNTRDWTFYNALDISPCSSSPCKNDGECVENPEQQEDFSCKCGVKYEGKLCEMERVFKSCKAVLNDDISSEAKNGIYKIKTNTTSGDTKVYCQMTSLNGCSGGGWTMVMKINGSKNTFVYSSNYWTNGKSYNTLGGVTAFDDEETKLETYHSTSFKELCLGMKVSNDLKFVSMNCTASSLYSLIADNVTRLTNLGRDNWKSLVASSSLQKYCNKEGFNIKPGSWETAVYIRVGITGNNYNNCNTPDSFIGFGGQVFTHTGHCSIVPTANACGNIAGCKGDNGNADIKAMGYILVR